MQVTMFKGLMPVNLPDAWFEKASEIKFANINGGHQAIDFRPCGGKALEFWVTDNPVDQHWAEIENPDSIVWGSEPHAIEPRRKIQMYGQSGTVLDLTGLDG